MIPLLAQYLIHVLAFVMVQTSLAGVVELPWHFCLTAAAALTLFKVRVEANEQA